MKVTEVEIYSDATNMAVMRHPGRNYPGVLIQGDTLSGLISNLLIVLSEKDSLSEDAAAELEGVYEHLTDLMTHYNEVLKQHKLENS